MHMTYSIFFLKDLFLTLLFCTVGTSTWDYHESGWPERSLQRSASQYLRSKPTTPNLKNLNIYHNTWCVYDGTVTHFNKLIRHVNCTYYINITYDTHRLIQYMMYVVCHVKLHVCGTCICMYHVIYM